MELFSFKKFNVAIDLGNNNTILTDRTNQSQSEPSFVVLNENNRTMRAVGKEAYKMVGKVPQTLRVVKPLKGGVIADFYSASKMLDGLIKNAYPNRSIFSGFSWVISGVPYSTTEVERRALRDTLGQLNSSKTFLLFEPLAAAIGLGLDIDQPEGRCLVDIGGGITEAVIISLSGIVNYHSIKIAGDAFDDDIQKYFRKNYNMDIGLSMAEQLKIEVGAAQELMDDIPEPFFVIGKDTITGIPRKMKIDHLEVVDILNSSIIKIEQAILRTLEECPPELAGDIYSTGIYVTGGGSLLRGLKQRFEAKFKIPIHQDPDALFSVARGISRVLDEPHKFQAVLFK